MNPDSAALIPNSCADPRAERQGEGTWSDKSSPFDINGTESLYYCVALRQMDRFLWRYDVDQTAVRRIHSTLPTGTLIPSED